MRGTPAAAVVIVELGGPRALAVAGTRSPSQSFSALALMLPGFGVGTAHCSRGRPLVTTAGAASRPATAVNASARALAAAEVAATPATSGGPRARILGL